jgi:NADH-quinone oxidoreductase subunit C
VSEPSPAAAPAAPVVAAKVWHIPLLPQESLEPLVGGLKARAETVLDTVQITVAPEDYRTLCERLFKAGFDFPSSLTGTDFEWGLGVALHLQQLESKRKVVVRTYCTYAKPHVPTVSDLWGGVDWHEREAYDLVGIVFDGHEDSVGGHPRRILLEDHWTTHPLQKRYNTRGYLVHGWTEKPFPSPAPWEEGFQPFSATPAQVGHIAPPPPPAGVSAAVALVSSVVSVGVQRAAPLPAENPVVAVQPAIAPDSAEGAPARSKKIKRWGEPKAEESTAPVVEASVGVQPVPENPVASSEPVVSSEAAPEEKPRSPKIKRWEPKN